MKLLLRTKAEAFLSDDYYESDLAWMELVRLPNAHQTRVESGFGGVRFDVQGLRS